MKKITATVSALTLILLISVAAVQAGTHSGTARLGYVYTDLTGNQGVYQPTYNLYEGVALSLENYHYELDNGWRATADIYNPFLKNRRLTAGFSKSGVGGLNVNHNSYRRVYDFDGDNATERRHTAASGWIRPIRQVKLFGGFGYTDKHGRTVDLIESGPSTDVNNIDYTLQDFHAGAEFKYRRSYGRVEYRGGDYNDDRDELNDRRSKRLRLTFYTPVPKYEDFVLSGGFQHFDRTMDNRLDTLKANTVWGAAQYAHRQGYKVRYSFMFDRARRHGDPVPTDNIIHAVHVGRACRGLGEITLGYGHRTNDDESVQRSGDEYSVTGRLQVSDRLSLRAGIDHETNVIDSGRTLTGEYDRARNWFSARYDLTDGFVRAKIEDREKHNDDIGSKLDFVRVASDGTITLKDYGELTGSAAYGKGDYENSAGLFEYEEYMLSGEAWSRTMRRLQAGVRGTYYRTRQGVDIEAFAVEISGRYSIQERTRLELTYSAHNFDNFDDPAEFYNQYYTANVVQVMIAHDL